MNCRHCGTELTQTLVDLGSAPPSNAYLTRAQLQGPEVTYPLTVMVCNNCWLVQTLDFARADELFDDEYAYFSSFSDSWVAHAERYVDRVVERFSLGEHSHVVEVASNDGYLLQFVLKRGIPCTGIEPTASTATVARRLGIETIESFFGVELAEELASQGKQADLMAANNVLAHVPDINDFLKGFCRLLKPEGVATFEFPHLMKLMEEGLFDTIYHEHFSYLSLSVVDRICAANGLSVFDVEELPSHGGSFRVYAQRADGGSQPRAGAVDEWIALEKAAGADSAEFYSGFQARAEAIKDDFVTFLIDAKRKRKRVAAYGAAAKGNTLMNFAGCRSDLIRYVVDRNPSKQGKFMPGSRIPIVGEAVLMDDRPDYVVILPWNLEQELVGQLAAVREWGGEFVTAVPTLRVFG